MSKAKLEVKWPEVVAAIELVVEEAPEKVRTELQAAFETWLPKEARQQLKSANPLAARLLDAMEDGFLAPQGIGVMRAITEFDEGGPDDTRLRFTLPGIRVAPSEKI
jgi:hypothetical protein